MPDNTVQFIPELLISVSTQVSTCLEAWLLSRSALIQLLALVLRPSPRMIWLLKGSETRLRRRFEPPPGPSQRRAERMEPFPPKPLHAF